MIVPTSICAVLFLVVALMMATTIYDLFMVVGLVCLVIAGLFRRHPDILCFLAPSMCFVGCLYIITSVRDTVRNKTHADLESVGLSWLIGSPVLTNRQKIVRANIFYAVEGCVVIGIGLSCALFPDVVMSFLGGVTD